MARAPFHGPRVALWECFLDGRPVTIAYTPIGRDGCIAQAREALACGRSARVVRTELCPFCGTASGYVEIYRRRRLFPERAPCPAHAAPSEHDEVL